MGWILDLSTNPPDIYTEDTVKDNVHTCLSSPFPAMCWFVNTTGDDLTHAGALDVYTCLSRPFPTMCWFVDVTETSLTHDGECIGESLGALCNCSKLTEVNIPITVKDIGANSFTFTKLRTVTIANDCTYGPESFPENCTIHTYS